MARKTICPHCKAEFALQEKSLGKKAKCKKCQSRFVVADGLGKFLHEVEEDDAVFVEPLEEDDVSANLAPVSGTPGTVAASVAAAAPDSFGAAPASFGAAPASPTEPAALASAPGSSTATTTGNSTATPSASASSGGPVDPSSPYESLAAQLSSVAAAPATANGRPQDYVSLNRRYLHEAGGSQSPSGANSFTFRGAGLVVFGFVLIGLAFLNWNIARMSWIGAVGCSIGVASGILGAIMVMVGRKGHPVSFLGMGAMPALAFIGLGALGIHVGRQDYWQTSRLFESAPNYELPNQFAQRPDRSDDGSTTETSPAAEPDSPFTTNFGNRNRGAGGASDFAKEAMERQRKMQEEADEQFARMREEVDQMFQRRNGVVGPTTNPFSRPDNPINPFAQPGTGRQAARPSASNSGTTKPTTPEEAFGSGRRATSNASTQPKTGQPKTGQPKTGIVNPFAELDSSTDNPFAPAESNGSSDSGMVASDSNSSTAEVDETKDVATAQPSSSSEEESAIPLPTFLDDTEHFHSVNRRATALRTAAIKKFGPQANAFPPDHLTGLKGISSGSPFRNFLVTSSEEPMLGIDGVAGNDGEIEKLVPVFSRNENSLVVAREGYAVGGLRLWDDGERLRGIQLVFMKIEGKKKSLKLIGKDFYKSEWIGEVPGNNEVEWMHTSGKVSYGLYYSGGINVEAVGLVHNNK